MEWSNALISMPRKTLGLNRATPTCHEPVYSIAAELPWHHSSPWFWSFCPLLKSLTLTLPLLLPDLSFRLNQPITLFFCFLLPDHMWQSLCNAQNEKWASSIYLLWNKPCHWAVNPWITHTQRRRWKQKFSSLVTESDESPNPWKAYHVLCILTTPTYNSFLNHIATTQI